MRQVLLGLFIVGQLLFILVSNVVSWFPPAATESADSAKEGSISVRQMGREAAAVLDRATRPWQELTGQLQGWSLYAPLVPRQAVFLAVEFRWDDAALPPMPALRSEIEPQDPAHFFRPFGTFRLAQYQAHLCLVMWAWNPEEAQAQPEVWRRRLADAVRGQWRPMQAYLRWRLAAFQRDRADWPPPRQAILVARIYRIPPPDQPPGKWEDPLEQAMARWRPEADIPLGGLPIESYNPKTRRFETVWIDE